MTLVQRYERFTNHLGLLQSPKNNSNFLATIIQEDIRSAVKEIQLITLYYTDVALKSVPVNYRIYNKQEGKTKNDYSPEMITSFWIGV